MAGGKETPRQKMIGMMYLVLTALLALNVSKHVLDSFVMVNDGLEETNRNFSKKVDLTYGQFAQQLQLNEAKVRPFYEKAQKVKVLSDSLVNFIRFSRTEMIHLVDGIPMEKADTLKLIDLQAKDNYSTSSRYWVTEGGKGDVVGGEGTRARLLRDKIRFFKSELLSVLSEEQQKRIKIGLDTEGPFFEKGVEKTWEEVTFDRVIPVAAATNLNRLITEVRNAEFDVISMLYGGISEEDFKFDQIGAKVVPKSNIVMLGDYYEAEIFVAAYDSKQNPDILVNNAPISVKDGVGLYRVPASAEGPRSYQGVIRVSSPSGGDPKTYSFKNEYVVQRPSVTVSADAMNVFYIGVDNPVSISVPGVPNDAIRPTISAGGQLVPAGPGKYNVRISPGTREARITVNAQLDGSSKSMGSVNFRVRTVPNPVPYIANKKEGLAAKEELLVAGAIIPRMENFDFDLRFEMVSFTMVTIVGGDVREFQATGGRLTPEMRGAIERSTRGQRITFENLIARGPDGNRPLPPINLRIQ